MPYVKLSHLNELRWRPKSWGTTRLSPAGIIATSSTRRPVDFFVAFFLRDEADTDDDCDRDRVERRTATGSATASASDDFFVRFDVRPLG